jgi:MYXO-CTERM domain-containing protein
VLIDQWHADGWDAVAFFTDATMYLEVARTMFVAPSIAIFEDGNEDIAWDYLNAAGITDDDGLSDLDEDDLGTDPNDPDSDDDTNEDDGSGIGADGGGCDYSHAPEVSPGSLAALLVLVFACALRRRS